MDIVKKIFEAQRVKRPKTKSKYVKYNPKIDGYMVTSSKTLERVVVAKGEDYYRYLAGEREHIYKDYDSTKQIMETEVHRPELLIEFGVPIGIYNITDTKSSELPPGFYRLEDDNMGVYLKKVEMPSDDYIEFRQDEMLDIYKDLQQFRANRDIYKNNGMRHKAAVLLYGAPGNGKTKQVMKILENSGKDELISIYIPSKIYDLGIIESFKQSLKGQDVVFVLEEITERANDDYKLEELLSFLDGELSWDNMYVIATTNNPEKLPANVVDRPGRFNRLIEFKNPTSNERRIFIKAKLGEIDDLEEVVSESEDLSLDYLNQSLLQSQIKKISVLEYLKELKKNKQKVKDSFQVRNKLGLGG